MREAMEESAGSHILALPLPAEGHIKPMLNLTNILSQRGHRITFVNTNHTRNRLQHFPNFHFASITDGLPDDYPRVGGINDFLKLISPTCRSMVAKEFRELFLRLVENNTEWQKPSCIIADGIMSTIALSVAHDFNVPFIAFRTYSATCTWVTIHFSKLLKDRVLLPQNQEDMDKMITRIPGIENLLRSCDLPSYLRILNNENFIQDFYMKETLAMTQASALILNTFEELEAPVITKLATIFPKVYTVGPLHSLRKTIVTKNSSSPHKDISLRKEDRSCITWLDNQKPKSVLYVSFGTVVKLSHEQLLEFWHGLVNSLKPFLWVIRKDLIIGEGGLGKVPMGLELGTKERGFIVDWAPQEEVLAHLAVGGFLTHSGWNSTLECIVEGVPMLCWPMIADQPVNSRCVSGQWKIGLDMSGTCDKLIVEKMVRDVMENHIEDIKRSATTIAEKARDSVKENGSSYSNLENLIKDISTIKVRN